MPIIEVTEPRRYHKPIVLPERLDLLTGPHRRGGASATPEVVRQPTLRPREPRQDHRPLSQVLHEALDPEDLYAYLNATMLKRLWTYMWIGPYVRKAWEDRFSELAELSRIVAAV